MSVVLMCMCEILLQDQHFFINVFQRAENFLKLEDVAINWMVLGSGHGESWQNLFVYLCYDVMIHRFRSKNLNKLKFRRK